MLGWGVGGIEAEAAMLGQPVSMLIPQVVGFRLVNGLPEGATATDLVLTVTQMLRERGVVGKFVEFYGPGLPNLPLADRATIGNMSPEMGATCAIFPVDAETLRYLEFSGRPAERVELVEAYCREQGLFHEPDAEEAVYSDTLELDLSTVGAVARRAAPAAGPGGAHQRGVGLPLRAGRADGRGGGARAQERLARRERGRVVPGQRPGRGLRVGKPPGKAGTRPPLRRRGPALGARRRSRWPTAPSSRSITARW